MAEHREEYLLRSAYIVSTVGDWIFRFALPLLVLDITGSAVSTAITYALEFVPYVLLGPFSGIVADAVDRRRLMIACDLTSLAIVGCIAVLCTAHQPPVLLVFAAAFVLACVRPLYFPAFQGFLVDRVEEDRRPVTNAWVQGSDSMLSLAGPVAGVAVVAAFGPAMACVANAASFGLSALLLAVTTARSAAANRPAIGAVLRRIRPDLAAGFRILIADPVLRSGTVWLTFTNFAALAVEANLVFILTSGGSRGHLAAVFAAQGAGAVLGAALAPRVLRRHHEGLVLRTGMATLAVALMTPALSTGVLVVGPAMFVTGMATSLIVIGWFTYRQRVVDREYMGRVVAVNRALSFAAIPPGALIGGWILAHVNAPALFLLAGSLQAVAGLATVLGPVGRARGLPRHA